MPIPVVRPVAPQRRSPRGGTRRVRARTVAWAKLGDEQLLAMRFCDLGLKLERTPLARHMRALYRDLERRGITFRPHAWIGEEWFSPDGVPGISIPFYLAHPRLERLERTMMKSVEGGNAKWLKRILRHEAGHALDTAYRLRRRKRWRDTFGPASLPYPDRYRARPGSRRYVQHLGDWYAQSHPTEDFAETFAVWLTPNSSWRRGYADWPAYQKLEFVDELMSELRGRAPRVRSRARIEPVEELTRTLGEHYEHKLERYRQYRRGLVDVMLSKVFTPNRPRRTTPRAGTLIRTARRELVDAVVREQGVARYSAYQILRMIIERSDQLRLYPRGSRRDAQRSVRWVLARLVRLYADSTSPQLRL
ncbi:MAG: putative zinc-binding metallopeptidase [Steroidobacteraceae bacterium]